MQQMILNIRKKMGYVPLEQYLQEKEQAQMSSIRDFERVIHILSSSVHEYHIQTAEKCFEVFKNKWNGLSLEIMSYNALIFENERNKVLARLPRVEESVRLLLT
jgi:hypothetical protein